MTRKIHRITYWKCLFIATIVILKSTSTTLAESKLQEGKQPGQEWKDSLGMTFCWCSAGEFEMGSKQSNEEVNPSRQHDAVPIKVKLTQGFWIGKFEVTQEVFDRFSPKKEVHAVTKQAQAPACGLSASMADDFVNLLNNNYSLPKHWKYALPTEAQWEYACRAGTDTDFPNDDVSSLKDYANFADLSLFRADNALRYAHREWNDGFGKQLAAVGSFRPNHWGIHDMQGNVAEWCLDFYDSKLVGGNDPCLKQKPAISDNNSGYRVFRGGAWCSLPEACAASYRNNMFPKLHQQNFVGMRLIIHPTP